MKQHTPTLDNVEVDEAGNAEVEYNREHNSWRYVGETDWRPIEHVAIDDSGNLLGLVTLDQFGNVIIAGASVSLGAASFVWNGPSTDPGVAGQVYLDGDTLKVSAG